MDVITKVKNFINIKRNDTDNNFLEARLNHDSCDSVVSTYLFLIFLTVGVIINVSTYVGTAIECTAPPQLITMTKWARYAQTTCLLKGTYFWPEELPLDVNGTQTYPKNKISYYALIPFLFIAASIFLLLPSLYWAYINYRSGFGMVQILRVLKTYEIYFHNVIGENVCQAISKNFSQMAFIQYRCKKYCSHDIGFNKPFNPQYLVRNYIMFKLLNVFSVVAIFFTFNYAFKGGFLRLGFDFMHRLTLRQYETSYLFPLFTLCDATFFQPNVFHTFQCVMTRNIFHDFIFTSSWFLLVISFVVSIVNLVISYNRLFTPKNSFNQLKLYLSKFLNEVEEDADRVDECVACMNETNPCDNCKRYFRTQTFHNKEIPYILKERITPDMLLCLWFIEQKTVNRYEFLAKIIKPLWDTRYSVFNEKKSVYEDKKLTLFADMADSNSSKDHTESNEFVD